MQNNQHNQPVTEVEEPVEETRVEEQEEDLEIPAFLRSNR
jgi:hypothetical protein